MSHVDDPSVCMACRAIDEGDGVIDGKLFKSLGVTSSSNRLASVKKEQQRVADSISAFAGSLTFVYLHIAWFAAWIVLNLGLVGRRLVFDPFPYGLLTMVVSLEAIFLSTFILITQNRQGERSEKRAEFDFRNNVRAEIWSAHIGLALGLDAQHVEHMVRDTVDGYLQEAQQP
jgi:uncharacterized membrane protein